MLPRSIASALRPATLSFLFFIVVGPACAQPAPITLLDDTFADGERLTQSWPRSAAWYHNQNTVISASLAVKNGALDLEVANASRILWSHFPAVSLKTGESLTVRLDFRFTAPVANGFRFGLCHTNGNNPRIGDGPPPLGSYQGYGLENLFPIKRGGPAAAVPDSQLLNQLSIGDQTVWDRLNTGGQTVRGVPFLADTPYSLTYAVARTGTNTVSITTTLTGAGLTGTNTLTVTDTGNVFTTFDTLGLAFVGNTLAGDMLISRASLIASVTPSTAGRLVNMSIRTNAGTGDNTLIVGVGVGGAGTVATKPVLFRAVGPTLGAFGVGGALADSIITAFQGSTQIAQNDDWGGGFDFAAVGAFALSGTPPRDAAIFNVSVPIGSYSLQITGKANATGIALAEIYDATPNGLFTSTTPRLINVSARTQVGTGDNILIAGFVVGGTTPVRVLVRAVGPTLGAFGVGGTLADPKLEIYSGPTTKVTENDNWGGTAELKAAFTSVAAFALSADNSRDAALIATLPPGSYTAQISGVSGTTGVALVELYELP